MTDIRLTEYLMERGYMADMRNGGIFPVAKAEHAIPFIINGKCVAGDILEFEGMSLEEFIEWENSGCCNTAIQL